MSRLFLDQWGNKFWAVSVKDLRRQIGNGGSRVSPMYIDKDDGSTWQVGYVIGPHWLTEYRRVERPPRE